MVYTVYMHSRPTVQSTETLFAAVEQCVSNSTDSAYRLKSVTA